jgi:hypothetical protein
MATRETEAGGAGDAGKQQRTGGSSSGSSRAGAARKGGAAAGAAKKSAGTKATGAKATGAKATARAGSKASRGDGAGARAARSGRGATAAQQGASDSTVSPALRKDLREFVQNHPGGWGHNEWIGLVNLLRDRGHDTIDTDRIGLALERERLTLVLERVPGLGARRVQAVADRYPRIWNVMQAGAEELAVAANLPKAVARRIKDALT